ncbi:MAG: HTTM domain-containing protein [Candidatus Eremiobacteraeota bacterium]|nr:HTTM domain-containing protein [Candidatus Eremiobacteraeota bacterium]
MREAWYRFWYSSTSPNLLCRGRALFCGALLLDALTQERALWADISPVFFNPTILVRLVGLPTYELCLAMEYIWQIALLAATIGLFTRVSVPVAAVLGTFVMGLPSSFCSFGQGNHHHYNVACIILWVLAFSRCGDAFSVDAWRAKKKTESDGEYTWPIRMIWITLCCMFFAAGLIKLRIAGPAWVLPENLSRVLIHRHYFPRTNPPGDWGLLVSQIPWACFLIASLALFIELAYPMGLLAGVRPHSRWRWAALIPAAMVPTLVGIRVLMGPFFYMVALAHIFWWPQRIEREITPPSRRRQAIVAILLTVILTGSAFDFIFKREDFPFSWYPMFASTASPDITRYLLFGVDAEGREWILQSKETYPPEDPTLDRIALHRTFRVLLDRPDDLREGVEDCLRRYRNLGLDLKGIRLYECHWEPKLTLEGREDPERTLVVEVR